jgi:hypothetical protein
MEVETFAAKEITACAAFVGSATLVAVRVTFCAELIMLGAKYNPFVTEPTCGLRDQVTPAFKAPVTEAMN